MPYSAEERTARLLLLWWQPPAAQVLLLMQYILCKSQKSDGTALHVICTVKRFWASMRDLLG